ncbi:MAG: segregation/condensation protein A [Firmicutes bacterium]|nr:segregation/condensation protein A [Bacillota bacterium]
MMEYKIMCPEFEGPLDLLLHLIKETNIDICDISIEVITKQYLDYINKMEELNLNVASEYLVMAAELLEIKSLSLLPKKEVENPDEYEEDPKDELIRRLLEYEKYKNITTALKECENKRSEIYTKDPSDLDEFLVKNNEVEETFSLTDLLDAFSKLLERKELDKPLNTKITNKEYSVNERSNEIRTILKSRKKVEFTELFETYTKDYLVVTFLSILDLAKKQELIINQDNNFNKIYLEAK